MSEYENKIGTENTAPQETVITETHVVDETVHHHHEEPQATIVVPTTTVAPVVQASSSSSLSPTPNKAKEIWDEIVAFLKVHWFEVAIVGGIVAFVIFAVIFPKVALLAGGIVSGWVAYFGLLKRNSPSHTEIK